MSSSSSNIGDDLRHWTQQSGDGFQTYAGPTHKDGSTRYRRILLNDGSVERCANPLPGSSSKTYVTHLQKVYDAMYTQLVGREDRVKVYHKPFFDTLKGQIQQEVRNYNEKTSIICQIWNWIWHGGSVDKRAKFITDWIDTNAKTFPPGIDHIVGTDAELQAINSEGTLTQLIRNKIGQESYLGHLRTWVESLVVPLSDSILDVIRLSITHIDLACTVRIPNHLSHPSTLKSIVSTLEEKGYQFTKEAYHHHEEHPLVMKMLRNAYPGYFSQAEPPNDNPAEQLLWNYMVKGELPTLDQRFVRDEIPLDSALGDKLARTPENLAAFRQQLTQLEGIAQHLNMMPLHALCKDEGAKVDAEIRRLQT